MALRASGELHMQGTGTVTPSRQLRENRGLVKSRGTKAVEAVLRRQHVGRALLPHTNTTGDTQRAPLGFSRPLAALPIAPFPQINPIFISNKWLAGGRGRKDTY